MRMVYTYRKKSSRLLTTMASFGNFGMIAFRRGKWPLKQGKVAADR